MTISIEDLKFQAILGILDFERVNAQDITLHVEIEYIFKNDEFINYADIATFIESDMKERKYLLIEDALDSLTTSLSVKYNNIQLLTLKITKPSILPNCKVSVAKTTKFS